MSASIINIANAPTRRSASGEHFSCSQTDLASELGAKAIGANITRVPPGKAAFPLHHHHANEEHFLVLSGSGILRLGHETHKVKANDYIVNLPGGQDQAHQLINTGAVDLVYLAISTQVLPEVVGYPDSGKTGVRTASGAAAASRFLVADAVGNSLPYWHGEDGAEVAAILARQR